MESITYKLCYDRCSSCDKGGNQSNNNCNECLKDNNNYIFHFLHDEKGRCISEAEKPLNTYLDLELILMNYVMKNSFNAKREVIWLIIIVKNA